MGVKYERDADGNVLNPPINQRFESLLYEAAQRSDQAEINEVQDEYHAWREDRIAREESREETSGPEVKLTAAPPSSGNAVQGAPQNIVVDNPADTQGPITETQPVASNATVETFESPMADPNYFDKLAAAIVKAQDEQKSPADSVQTATDTGQNPPAHEVGNVPPAAPPADGAEGISNTPGSEGGNA